MSLETEIDDIKFLLTEELSDEIDIIKSDYAEQIADLKTRHEVLTWYLEMNTGGTIHTTEEISRVQKLLEAEQ